tara:strand:+ start:376 stop:495 length:120 start_codon:yes stop_codon:yes gene_type:complete
MIFGICVHIVKIFIVSGQYRDSPQKLIAGLKYKHARLVA